MNKKTYIFCGALLMFALALSLILGLTTSEDDTRTENAIKAINGRVVREETAEGKPIVEVHLGDKRATNFLIRRIAWLDRLHRLVLNTTDVNDASLKELSRLKQLR